MYDNNNDSLEPNITNENTAKKKVQTFTPKQNIGRREGGVNFAITKVDDSSEKNNDESMHLSELDNNNNKKEHDNNDPEEKQSWLSKHYNRDNSLMMFIIFGLCFCASVFIIEMICVTKSDKSNAFFFAPGALISFVGAFATYCCPGEDEPYPKTFYRSNV